MTFITALALILLLLLGGCAQVPYESVEIDSVTDQRPPAAWLADGAQALADGDALAALKSLARYRMLVPESATGAFLAGVARLDLEQRELARSEFEEAVRLDPTDVSALSLLAHVSFELDDPERGLGLLERLVAINPEDAASQTALGLAYFQAGELGRAYRALLTAVRNDPTHVSAHVGLGRLLCLVGDLEQAALAYRTALELSGDSAAPALHVSMAHVLRDLERMDEALGSYRAAELGAPDDPRIAANIAATLYDLGRWEEARAPIERAVSQLEGAGIDMALVHLIHGVILEALGDTESALQALLESVQAEPGFGRAHRALCEMLLDLGRWPAAREQLALALDYGVLDDQLVLELALLHERAGDRDGARQCAAILLAATAERPYASLALAELRLRSHQPGLKDVRAAEAELRMLSSGPLNQSPHAWALLGEALAQLGALDEAVEALDRGLLLVGDESPTGERFRDQRARLLGHGDDP
jgi:tetratricopeptide (TPR) repeat protein